MALNYADRLAVRVNIVGRCTGIVSTYALYLLGLGGSATDQQKAWANDTLRSAGAMGEKVSWHVVNLAGFIADGSGIGDEDLKNAVESAVNANLIPGY